MHPAYPPSAEGEGVLTLFISTSPPPWLAPYCATFRELDGSLRSRGFTAEDTILFTGGGRIIRYRFLGDMLWVALWPDGRACLLRAGLMQPSRQP